MQGIAFQGAFFAASPTMANAGLTEDALFTAIEAQLQSKFGGKGARVVADNLRVVRRGFTELTEITEKEVGVTRKQSVKKDAGLPIMLKQIPVGDGKTADIHRFWEQTGNFYAERQGQRQPGRSLHRRLAGAGGDRRVPRHDGHPLRAPEVDRRELHGLRQLLHRVPRLAIPGLVTSVSDVFATALNRIETRGTPTRYLRRAVRSVEKKLRALIDRQGGSVRPLIDIAIDEVIAETPDADRAGVAAEFTQLQVQLGGFQFGTTKPYWNQREKKAKGSGGLFSITINPYTCKGCALCVTVCDDEALRNGDADRGFGRPPAPRLERLARPADHAQGIQPHRQPRREDRRAGNPAARQAQLQLHGLRRRRLPRLRREDRDPPVHLTVTALMQPRVESFIARLDDLIVKLEQHMRVKLASAVDLTDTGAVVRAVDSTGRHDLTLSSLATKLNADKPSQLLDPAWVKNTAQLLEKLKDLKWRYVEGPTGRGRAEMGIVNSTGCTSVWGSTYPYHPYPFPWTSTCSRIRPRWPWDSSRATWPRWPKASRPCASPRRNSPATTCRTATRTSSAASTGRSSRPTSGCSARRWCRSAATARCTTSASRTCRAP
jgi:pyruvate-ferredoxin/flavodoxin oxidoreductase